MIRIYKKARQARTPAGSFIIRKNYSSILAFLRVVASNIKQPDITMQNSRKIMGRSLYFQDDILHSLSLAPFQRPG